MGEKRPNFLFFSGGSAIADLSCHLKDKPIDTTYVITTFDSGGSTAKLRRAFDMVAVGDIRNRLLALAACDSASQKKMVEILGDRLEYLEHDTDLKDTLREYLSVDSLKLADIEPDIKKQFCDRMNLFVRESKGRFHASGASVGNIFLAACFLAHDRKLEPAIVEFAKILGVHESVKASSVENGHLAVRLESGRVISGQHLFTGKKSPAITSPVKSIWICADVGDEWPRSVVASASSLEVTVGADLIVYPMGSFYSSIVAAVLPRGYGRALKVNKCSKVFVPNTVFDPELMGHSVDKQVRVLVDVLRRDDPKNIKESDVLDVVLIDSNATYENGINVSAIEEMGIKVVYAKLLTPESNGKIDSHLLSQKLMDFI